MVPFDDDVVRNRQPEAGTFAYWLGREEGVEDSLPYFWRDTDTGVLDFEPDLPVLDAGADEYLAVFVNRLRSIDQEIHENLVDLRRQAIDWWEVTRFEDDFRLVLEFVADNVEGAFQGCVEIGKLLLGLVDTGENS